MRVHFAERTFSLFILYGRSSEPPANCGQVDVVCVCLSPRSAPAQTPNAAHDRQHTTIRSDGTLEPISTTSPPPPTLATTRASDRSGAAERRPPEDANDRAARRRAIARRDGAFIIFCGCAAARRRKGVPGARSSAFRPSSFVHHTPNAPHNPTQQSVRVRQRQNVVMASWWRRSKGPRDPKRKGGKGARASEARLPRGDPTEAINRSVVLAPCPCRSTPSGP